MKRRRVLEGCGAVTGPSGCGASGDERRILWLGIPCVFGVQPILDCLCNTYRCLGAGGDADWIRRYEPTRDLPMVGLTWLFKAPGDNSLQGLDQ